MRLNYSLAVLFIACGFSSSLKVYEGHGDGKQVEGRGGGHVEGRGGGHVEGRGGGHVEGRGGGHVEGRGGGHGVGKSGSESHERDETQEMDMQCTCRADMKGSRGDRHGGSLKGEWYSGHGSHGGGNHVEGRGGGHGGGKGGETDNRDELIANLMAKMNAEIDKRCAKQINDKIPGLMKEALKQKQPKMTCNEVIREYKSFNINVTDCLQANGSLFWRIDEKLDWSNASAACRRIAGADLTSIHSFEEKRHIYELVSHNMFPERFNNTNIQLMWIGLHREKMDCSKKMVWSDGTVVDFEDWLPGEPNCFVHKEALPDQCGFKEDEKCAHVLQANEPEKTVWPGISGAPAWNDSPCCYKFRSICRLN